MKLVIGDKIKRLRLTSDLTQEELANRAGLSKGFISQLENDQTSIQIDSLSDLLEALGVSLSEFFSDVDEEKVVYDPSEYVAVDGTGASSFELMVPRSTNNRLDPVLLRLNPGESLAKRDPHPGEQFGYVLSGRATVTKGRQKYIVTSKQCFSIETDKPYQIQNEGGRPVSMLWIVTPPQM